MVGNSTDKTIGDTSNLVSRVIQRGSVDVTSFSAYGTLYRSSGSVILNDIKSENNNIIECYYYYDLGIGTSGIFSNLMNYSRSYSVGAGADGSPLNIASYYLTSTTSNGVDVIQLNWEVIIPSVDGFTRRVYYLVYSSGFSDEVVF